MAAAEVSSAPVNGNYAQHHGYGGVDQQPPTGYAYNGAAAASSQPAAPPTSSATAANQHADVSKDEVGWYFVEQYYTTLSKSPDKLFLFYNKRSQYVSGEEAAKVNVCVGQRAINDRIKEHGFQNSKVRVTNVDSQASDSNIVIQVIGHLSNNGLPHHKFSQTFVLATQTNGYFVLNDIFRFLTDEEDEAAAAGPAEAAVAPVVAAEEAVQPPAAAAAAIASAPAPIPAVEPKTLTNSTDPVAVENDAKRVDKGLEEKVLNKKTMAEPTTAEHEDEDGHVEAEEAPAVAVNGVAGPEHVQHAEDAPAAVVPAQSDSAVDLQPEKPGEPEPTPVASPPTTEATPRSAPAPAKPAVPKTWASLAASAHKVATPVTPHTTASATSQSKPTPSPAKAIPPTAAPPAPSTAPSAPAAPTAPTAWREESPMRSDQHEEWTAVGATHNRQPSRQTNAPQQRDGPLCHGYIKNVHENVDGHKLRASMEEHAEIVYFDINPQKNCAFVEFKTPAGYEAVVKANPHVVNGEHFYVEERRFSKGPPGFGQRGGGFHGGRGRGNMNQGPQRGGYQNRGGYQPRGGRGGGASTPRGGAGGAGAAAGGRGGAQAA